MHHVMIHNVRRKMFDIGLPNYRMTFDDGLFSQYYYFPEIRKYGDIFIFFLTTSLIGDGRMRSRYDGTELPYVKSGAYMFDAFVLQETGHFMRTAELKWLASQPGVILGLHSHFHDIVLTTDPPKKPLSQWKLLHCPAGAEGAKMNRRSKLAFKGYTLENGHLVERTETQWMDYVRYDTESALNWFDRHLGVFPESYCFPFNEYNETLLNLLKTFGFKKFYNGRPGPYPEVIPRVDIDTLLRESRQ
jgi:peptidoglycan/xylan/chitin deacetylase (PgdA/CDA1 family)